jgi:hypothetical protein
MTSLCIHCRIQGGSPNAVITPQQSRQKLTRAQCIATKTHRRTPDIIVQPVYGTIYTKSTSNKVAEHGGFSFGDTNVGLIVFNPGMDPQVIKTPVLTSQVAATILKSLGIDPGKFGIGADGRNPGAAVPVRCRRIGKRVKRSAISSNDAKGMPGTACPRLG